ncbi:MAG: hypothetical protein M9945_14375 [Aquamicrobium sp.]|uniref:hypothetical protein n=1 Tax=Aquamicrobium sp. TaxID=1872579 RepID=UPI00349EEA4D|nr:hypothetical protein [Aquamicrobium sp.]
MHINVVFTGPAVTSGGKIITRKELTQACTAAGLTVQSTVRRDTDFLVSSRTDTVKARNAKLRGLTVMPYESFINGFLDGVELSGAGTFDPFTDVVAKKRRPPAFSDGEQLALMDVL